MSSAGPPRLTLRRNFSWTLLGNAIYALSTWLMLTVLAKTGTQTIVGQYALALAVTQPIVLLSQLQLRTLQATDARQQYRFGHYVALRLLTTLGALIVAAFFAVRSGESIKEASAVVTGLAVMIVGATAALDGLSDVIYGLLQQHERMERIAISMIAKGPLSLLGLGIGAYFTGSVLWAALGSTLASFIVLVTYDIRGVRIVLAEGDPAVALYRPIWDWPTLARIAWLALPLGIAMLLVSLTANVPRYIIVDHFGLSQLAVFSAMVSLIGVGKLMVTALGQSASPRLASCYASGRRQAFCSLMFKLVGIAAVIGASAPIAALICGRWLLTILYTPAYAERSDVFALLLAAGGLSYIGTVFGVAISATRHFKIQVPSCMVITLAAWASSMWLIPSRGLMGAGLAALVTAGVQVAMGAGVIGWIIETSPWQAPQADLVPAAT